MTGGLKPMRTLSIAAALAITACGGSDATHVAAPSVNLCAATYTGAFSGTNNDCAAEATVDSAGNVTITMAFGNAPTGLHVTDDGLSLLFTLPITGLPTASTYSSTDASAKGDCEVFPSLISSFQSWAADGSAFNDAQGSYKLTVTSVGGPTASAAFGAIHGSLTCTALPANGQPDSMGPVTVVATF
jgi:hypothetical protein